MNKKNLLGKKVISISLFAAFICAGTFIQIPLPGGVPIVIQNMLALLAGLLLGHIYGTASVVIFLILGSIGLPVFSGKSGLPIITQGPTGGFLIGYAVSALVSGLILTFALRKKADSSKDKEIKEWLWIAAAAIAGTIACYVFGILRFHQILPNKTMKEVFAATVLPFIPGMIIKLAASIVLTKKLRPVIANYIN